MLLLVMYVDNIIITDGDAQGDCWSEMLFAEAFLEK